MKNLSLLFLALVANSVQAFPLEESMKFQLQSRDVVQGLASQACTDVFIIVVRGTGDQIPNSQVDYSAKVACDSLVSNVNDLIFIFVDRYLIFWYYSLVVPCGIYPIRLRCMTGITLDYTKHRPRLGHSC